MNSSYNDLTNHVKLFYFKNRIKIAYSLTLTLLLLSYQNCSTKSFESENLSSFDGESLDIEYSGKSVIQKNDEKNFMIKKVRNILPNNKEAFAIVEEKCIELKLRESQNETISDSITKCAGTRKEVQNQIAWKSRDEIWNLIVSEQNQIQSNSRSINELNHRVYKNKGNTVKFSRPKTVTYWQKEFNIVKNSNQEINSLSIFALTDQNHKNGSKYCDPLFVDEQMENVQIKGKNKVRGKYSGLSHKSKKGNYLCAEYSTTSVDQSNKTESNSDNSKFHGDLCEFTTEEISVLKSSTPSDQNFEDYFNLLYDSVSKVPTTGKSAHSNSLKTKIYQCSIFKNKILALASGQNQNNSNQMIGASGPSTNNTLSPVSSNSNLEPSATTTNNSKARPEISCPDSVTSSSITCTISYSKPYTDKRLSIYTFQPKYSELKDPVYTWADNTVTVSNLTSGSYKMRWTAGYNYSWHDSKDAVFVINISNENSVADSGPSGNNNTQIPVPTITNIPTELANKFEMPTNTKMEVLTIRTKTNGKLTLQCTVPFLPDPLYCQILSLSDSNKQSIDIKDPKTKISWGLSDPKTLPINRSYQTNCSNSKICMLDNLTLQHHKPYHLTVKVIDEELTLVTGYWNDTNIRCVDLDNQEIYCYYVSKLKFKKTKWQLYRLKDNSETLILDNLCPEAKECKFKYAKSESEFIQVKMTGDLETGEPFVRKHNYTNRLGVKTKERINKAHLFAGDAIIYSDKYIEKEDIIFMIEMIPQIENLKRYYWTINNKEVPHCSNTEICKLEPTQQPQLNPGLHNVNVIIEYNNGKKEEVNENGLTFEVVPKLQ